MVKRVVITNYLGESVEYKIEGVDVEANNGLFITEIEGLGPPSADLIFTKMVNIDGSLYNSGRINGRNIIIKARFLNAETIEDARLLSYRFFPMKKPLRFEVETENRKAYTIGYVEKNEPNIFSDKEEVQISVMCESALLNDSYGESEEFFSNGEALFEFVYENEGHDPVTEFGNYEDRHVSIVNYKGETEVGYTMRLHATGPVVNPTINFISSEESLTFDTKEIHRMSGKYFDSGDDIILTMLPRTKTCYFVSDGHYTNILNLVDRGFSWPSLTPGPTNLFSLTDGSGGSGCENLQVFITYQAVYEGV